MDKTMVQDGTIRITDGATLEVKSGRGVLKVRCRSGCDECLDYGDHWLKLSEGQLEALREELNR